MKILNKKNKKKSFKIIIYAVLVYLIATWGVNQVVNPVVYVQNIISQDKYAPVVEKREDTIVIQPTESVEEFPCISFKINCDASYKFPVQLVCVKESGETESKTLSLENGVNTIKVEQPDVVEIQLAGNAIKEYAPEIKGVMQAPFAKVNWLKTLEVGIAFAAIFAFWEGLQYIKTKYTVN